MAVRGFGINFMVWSSRIGPEERALLPVLAEMGYGAAEVPIFAPDDFPASETAAALRDANLDCTVSTALPAGCGLADPVTAPAGLDFLRRLIRTAATLQSGVICGPLILPVGELRGRGPTADELKTAAKALAAAGRMAADAGIVLALEPLNRFETYIVNTVDQGVRLMEDVNHPAVGLLLDTFHMQIEEKSTPGAVVQSAAHLRHFHASENDRGIVGSGQAPWKQVWSALHEIDYSGWVTVESFNAFLPELAGATCIWRPMAPDPMTLARESLAFLRSSAVRVEA